MTNVKMKANTLKLVQASIIVAILILLQVTNLGFILVPPVSISIMHVPVIMGAVMLGPWYGGFFGGVMGICSLLNATFRGVSPVDLAFSPFASGHPIGSVFMSVVVRILIGIVAGFVFNVLAKKGLNIVVNSAIAAVLGTLTNTVGVMVSLWLIFTELNVTLKLVLETIFVFNFLLEVTAAVVFAVAIAKIFTHIKKQ